MGIYKYFVEMKSIAVSGGMEEYMSVALRKGIWLKKRGEKAARARLIPAARIQQHDQSMLRSHSQ